MPARPPALLLAALAAAATALAAPSSGPATPARAPDAKLPARLARALAVPHVPVSRSAAVAVDLRTGQVLFSRHPRLGLAPASTEKLAVSYALLTQLGPSYRIRTVVGGTGTFAGGTWRGHLVLEGRGDPTLSSGDLASLARQVRRAGIRRVTGSVVADESYFDRNRTAPGWKSWFFVNECAPISAALVDGGLYHGRPARNPALAAAGGLRRALREAGVSIGGPARVAVVDPTAELAAVSSEPLGVVLRRVNSDSDNTSAELLLKHLGAVTLGRGTTAAGTLAVRRALDAAGVPLGGVRLVDGSGLSRLDRLTADALVGILVTAWQDPTLRRSLLGTLAVAGVRGTLEHRLQRAPAAGRVYAKTGTTSISSALAGYVGGRYAFAVLTNGAPVSSWWARRAQDRFVTVLAR
jgi:D-alanyl-D-alanine carboxypeptidase/D-alanyl-D-alanine-endopeptidase (penicillin-binding protein 4)